MATEWYCRIMGEEWGPMSALELMAVARWGRLSRDDLVRRKTDGTWVRAELVKGLFNAPPAAPTATSDRLAADGRKPLPAKRSVRKVARTQYWVKVGDGVGGPYSSREIRRMAEAGAIKPADLISRDRHHWLPAAKVKNISFGGGRPESATMSVRSAVSLDAPLASPDDEPTADYPASEAGEAVLMECGDGRPA